MQNIPDKVVGDLLETTEFNKGINQELKSVVAGTGQGFDDSVSTQMLRAMGIVASSRLTYVETVSSTGAIYEIEPWNPTVTTPLSALQTGAAFTVRITHSNTVTNPTLSFNPTLGAALTIKNSSGSALFVGELEAGFIVDFVYDGTDILIKSLNDATSQQEIAQGNFYTATVSSANNWALVAASGHVTAAYYDGLVVTFVAPAANTAPLTLAVDGLLGYPVYDSGNATLISGSVQSGDLLSAVFVTNKFLLIKRTTDAKIGANGLVIRSPTGFVPAVTTSGAFEPAVATLTLTAASDKESYKVELPTTTVVALPTLAATPVSFSTQLYIVSTTDGTVTISATGADTVNGAASIVVTCPPFYPMKLEIFRTTTGWYCFGAAQATETVGGVARFATLAEVTAGASDITMVSPKTLADNPIYVNLNEVYPVGTSFKNKSALMVTDPDMIVPAWGVFTWVAEGTAGQGYANVSISPTAFALHGVGIQNDMSADMGDPDAITGPHTLIEGEIPAHVHDILYIGTDNLARLSGFAGSGSPNARPQPPNDVTGETGGSQPHWHPSIFQSYCEYSYTRTA